MTEPATVHRYPDPDVLAEAIAERLLAELTRIQAAGRDPQLCLTGGRIAGAVYGKLAVDGPRSNVEWPRIDLWWGDERFVPVGDSDRNDLAALSALAPLGIAPDRVHPMPASGDGDLDRAAADYAEELDGVVFDICLLGVGPDGHVASLFPDHPSVRAPGRVIGVRNSPKPPPQRISLTLEVINASAQVWLCVSGADKADAVALAHSGGPVPAASVHGREATVWLVDEAAAARVRS